MNHSRVTIAALSRCVLALISVCVLASSLSAAPMVYTGLVVTDVRVGNTLFHNASLKITFEGDTNNILQVPVPSTECGGNGFFLFLSKGIARMQIEFQGHTRTARLNDGQLFVALDTCNGGIGFGSFTGPNGLEPAYPLAFTMGTAEYASIIYPNPLNSALSTTGSAWSCIGYPPGGASDLPGTPTGNCIPPDSYPLHSSIGDIFVYQPYQEFVDPTILEVASNHSGSTNRGVFLVRPKPSRSLATPIASEHASSTAVVYTLQTVADGWIGDHVFAQALVTFRMVSNRRSVTTQPSPVDPTKPLYENRAGRATVTVDDGGNVITAQFAPGEVYVRYDTGAGVAGFGSQISPTYPVALNCSDSAYPSESTYTADCLQGEAWNYLNSDARGFDAFHSGILAQLSLPGTPSPGVQSLPQSLSRNTLLTGPVHTCASVYTFSPSDPDFYFPGDLLVCAAPAPRGLITSKGDLFLQDLVGGSLDLGNIVIVQDEAASDPGWDLSNSGFLHVEVYRGDD
jgi:hypothetical protein